MNRNNKNYAQAAAAQSKPNNNNTHHQNQQHHHQQVSQQNQTSGTSTSSNYSSSANGKAINKSQTKPQAQHNSTMGNGNTGRSASIKQKNPVQLPTNGHAWEKKTLEFGSINTPNAQISSSTTTGPTLTSGGGLPTTLPTKGGPTFGTLSNTSTQTTQTTQASPTTVGTSGPGVNNNNNNNSNSNSNNNNGVSPKPISTRAGEIPRTHSAPPQIQDNRNVGQPYLSNVPTTRTIHQQQSTPVSHQQPSASVSNPPLNHRKDSVSSTVSSNDGQPPFHPHHSPHHPNHHNNHNNHHHYGRHHSHKPNMGPPQNQYRPRDKNVTHPSQHLNPAQSVSTQGVPMAGPPQMWYNRDAAYHIPFYPGYPPVHHPNMYITQPYAMQPRPPQIQQIQQPHLTQVPTVSYKPPNTATKQQSRAIEIIDPSKNAPIQYVKQHQPQLSKSPIKREEASPAVFDKKPEESDKEKPSSEDKGISKAVPIVDPAERERKEREEQERLAKEKEEQERKEREERERLEVERKEKEEKERREREEREEKERIAKEKEEQERKEREKREREEKERLEKERLERERKEREERERKEREEQERIAKEKEEQERKEREERERLEVERLEKERLERERKEREERERKEREEQERIAKEKEEQERKEREEKERLEKERLEAERIEKEKKEKEEKERREAEEKTRKEQEEKEKEEIERKKREEEEAKTKVAEDDEKKKEKEAESNDSKKEEKKYGKGHRPGPLDLSRTTSAPAIPSAPLSALGSARAIDDINSVQYPEGISSPNPALNSNAEPGKFKYDRSFLMQFMGVCKEKPENLPALEAIGMEEPKDDKRKTRPSVSRSNSTLHKNSPQFAMGEFKFPPKTSEERFAVSNMRNGPPGIFGRTLGSRTGSGNPLLPTPGSMSASTPQSPSRTSSGRGATRKGGKGSHQVTMNVGEQVAPLERSENRWVPGQDPTLHKTPEGLIPIESIQRKVKALLNKLTLEKFDSISDQIVEYANKSRDERDGRILREVIRLIFEKSCDESNFCAMYAQLCRKMMERVDPEIVDENVKNTEGKFVQGGTLFRKYLLNRCQEDFEKGWKVNIPVPSNEKGEPDLLSDEYYVAAKAKRQGLGLIRFIGELFKLNMLTERIMHECIKKLLIYQGSPEEEEMESLCKLMNTVGEQLDHVKTNPHEHIKANQIDHAKAKQLMESYFNRMEEISKLPNLSSRIKFMIMDVIDLRNNAWKPRRDINAPKTIAEIHEDAAKQKEEAEFLRRSASSGGKLPKISEQMSRSGSGRRDHKGSPGNDGWINVGNSSQRKDKVGDLTKFGSVNRGKITGNNFSLAPGGLPLSGGAKGWKSDNKDRDDKTTVLSRTNSTSNMYSVLTAESSEGRKSSESSSSEIQKPSPPTERKRIILAPRTKNITAEEPVSDKPAPRSNPEAVPSVQSMSNNELTKKINNMMEEYFSVLDIKEVIQCIKEIPQEHHAKAIESFANKVLEKKQKDVDNVMKLFKEIVSSETCDINTFKSGFGATLDFLMEIGADAPMSYSFTGQLLFSAGLDFRDITKLLIPLDHDKSIEKIVKGYTSALKNVDEQKYVQKITEFDFKSLFPKKNKDEINKYLEDLGLESSKK